MLIASTVGNTALPYHNLAIHDADGMGVPHALDGQGPIGLTSPDMNLDRPWIDGTAAVFHVEFEIPAICRSVVDIPAILRVNSFAEGQPYPLLWLDREAPPGARSAAETPEPPVEIGGGGEHSGVP